MVPEVLNEMSSEKPNRFWFVSGLLLAIIFTVAFRTGELVELDAYLNQQAGSIGAKISQNVQFIVPKGTEARVLAANRLESGNYAVKLEIQGSGTDEKSAAQGAGRHVWILYSAHPSMDSFGASFGMSSNSSVILNPQTGSPVQFVRDTPAISEHVSVSSADASDPLISLVETKSVESEPRWQKTLSISSIQGRGLASESF
ncbi:MAG: hypothetical protein P4M08_10630 [Oligoflexia bacterium]|nr:hypothetical protein [Oligoflexia bacterium]